ncbi:MAG: hypothetical protein DCF31_10740 [Alphaproteobacteria bacterium]|nr:MAG: hypothetical protein DCF31_10740 [Alphaproteobacteria bacterium]
MSFASPGLLLAALAATLGLLLHWRIRRPARDADPPPAVLHAVVAGSRVGVGRALPRSPWRFGIGLLLLALAIGRPQWGTRPDDSQVRQQIVIALDLSKSMTAADAVPTRIARAQAIAADLVARAPTADIGLIGFAGRAFLLAAPSPDRTLLDTFLPAVHPEQMIVPGSNLAAMLTVALDSFGASPAPRTLVLLSDGEADPTPWRQLLPRLTARRIRVVAVGFGTPAGAPVPIAGDRNLVDAGGTEVRSRLDTATLRALAAATGGTYLDAGDARDLPARIDALGRQATGPTAAGQGRAKVDRFAWVLVPALLFLLWSALVEWPALPRRPLRRRAVQPAILLLPAVLALLGTAGAAVRRPALPAEPDPLRDVKQVVGTLVARPQPGAADYLALAEATARYGEAHRQHTHPLQIGVLQDGLVAVEAGAARAPDRREWAPLRARLQRLLRPPRTADDPEEGDGAPDGEGAPGEAPDADEAGHDPNGAPPDTRRVGGTQRTATDNAEWRVPSLVKPAFILERLRAADQPGTLFRLLQRQDPAPPRQGGQTW